MGVVRDAITSAMEKDEREAQHRADRESADRAVRLEERKLEMEYQKYSHK